jgi:hypothetical protein
MLQSFDLFTGANLLAIQQAGELGVQQSIIPLIELTRFVFEDHAVNELGRALQKLTGASIGGAARGGDRVRAVVEGGAGLRPWRAHIQPHR